MFIAKKVILVMLSVFAFIACSPNTHDVEKTIKGPIAKVAFDENNNLTKAGEGFANKNNVDKNDLYETKYISPTYPLTLSDKKKIKALYADELGK